MNLTKPQILARLRNDEDYYGEFGKQFLSNSDIIDLLTQPHMFRQETEKTVNLVVGGYFHTLVLEPHKVDKYKVIKATTRNTNAYKELSDGEVCLLEHEVDQIQRWRDRILENTFLRNLIVGDNVEYEVPGVGRIEGEVWKGKADIINHDERLVIDLKTTGEIDRFRYSASKFNYDSQAYLYRKLFGYELVFAVVDKKTERLAFYECSDQFLQSGANKVAEAVQIYTEYKQNPDVFLKEHLQQGVL